MLFNRIIFLFMSAPISMVAILGSAIAQQMDLNQMTAASGVATIISNSKPCNYTINQSNLAKYLTDRKLDTPEVLSFIDGQVSIAGIGGDEPNLSQCTIAKVTAAKAGLLD